MEISEAQYEELQARSMRDFGIALLLLTGILGGLFLLPVHVIPPAATGSTARTVDHSVAPAVFSNVDVQAKAAIVIDLKNDRVLFEKDADAQLPLASLTKLLAVYAAVDAFPLEKKIAISARDANVDAPRAFTNGDAIPLGQLARLTLTASLNDGASAMVDAVAREKGESSAQVLTRTANALGLTETYANNGNGLDLTGSVSGAYGSARDMARLAGALVRRAPDIAIATTRSFAAEQVAGGASYRVKNTNPDVRRVPQLLLSKTGYTDLAGGNLALVFDVGIEHPVAVVVLGSTKASRFTDSELLVKATRAYFANIQTL